MTTTSRSNSRLEAGAAILVNPSAASATHIPGLSARLPYRRFDTRSAGHAITNLGAHSLISAEELFGLITLGPATHQLTSGPHRHEACSCNGSLYLT
jgi:hypothetical protein